MREMFVKQQKAPRQDRTEAVKPSFMREIEKQWMDATERRIAGFEKIFNFLFKLFCCFDSMNQKQENT